MTGRFEFDWQILDYCEDLNHDGWSGAAVAHECALELLKARRELVALRERHDEQLSKVDRLRAELARLAPLAEAAVAHWQARDADDSAALNATSNAVWDAVKAYARAQAQDGAA